MCIPVSGRVLPTSNGYFCQNHSGIQFCHLYCRWWFNLPTIIQVTHHISAFYYWICCIFLNISKFEFQFSISKESCTGYVSCKTTSAIIFRACVLYFFIFYQKQSFQKLLKMIFISFKKLFYFSRYSIVYNFFPLFPRERSVK